MINTEKNIPNQKTKEALDDLIVKLQEKDFSFCFNSFSLILHAEVYLGIQKRNQLIDLLIKQATPYFLAQKNNLSFANGLAGFVYCLIKAYERTKDKKYLNQSVDLILKDHSSFLNSKYVGDSLHAGRAGVLFVIFYLYVLTQNTDLLNLINQYSRKIISNAIPYGTALVWYNPTQLVIQPLCSLGYGVAGIGYVFWLLSKYFDHPPFKLIYDKVSKYLNTQAANIEKATVDYRSEIKNFADLEQHKMNTDSFFENPQINYSAAHGLSGILFFYARTHAPIPKWNQDDYLDSLDMRYLLLNLTNSTKNNTLINNQSKTLQPLSFPSSASLLEQAVFQLNYQKGVSTNYWFPELNFNIEQGEIKEKAILIKTNEIQQLLLYKKFPKTFNTINSIPEIGNFPDQNQGLNISKETVHKIIKKAKASELQQNILQSLLQYDENLWEVKKQLMHNPKNHLNVFLEFKKRLLSLQILDTVLLQKSLQITPELTFKKYFVVDDISKTNQAPPETMVFWKKEVETGIKEIPMGFLYVIVQLFKKGKKIETALLEMIFYCVLQKEKKLNPLIKFSNSKNKKDLLDRLPFLFIYQIRLLVADGILSFYKPERGLGFTAIKPKILKLILQTLNITYAK